MQWFNEFMEQAKSKLAQYNNRTFRDAAMAVCALIAAADGSVDATEKKKVAALISKNELLSVFNAAELGVAFMENCDKAVDDFGRVDLIGMVRKLKSDSAQADTVLRVAIIIANADGDFSDDEKKVVKELCGALGLPSADYI